MLAVLPLAGVRGAIGVGVGALAIEFVALKLAGVTVAISKGLGTRIAIHLASERFAIQKLLGISAVRTAFFPRASVLDSGGGCQRAPAVVGAVFLIAGVLAAIGIRHSA